MNKHEYILNSRLTAVQNGIYDIFEYIRYEGTGKKGDQIRQEIVKRFYKREKQRQAVKKWREKQRKTL